MSRKIKFRGFHPNKNGNTVITVNGEKIRGKWVHGFYMPWHSDTDPDGREPYAQIYEDVVDRLGKWYIVLSETVGQFTGLTAINGKEIFEGDIVEGDYTRYRVVYGRLGWDSSVGLSGFTLVAQQRILPEIDIDLDTGEAYYECARGVNLKKLSIVGNIFEEV